jgi:PPOX class probable F420-dependent enzyme
VNSSWSLHYAFAWVRVEGIPGRIQPSGLHQPGSTGPPGCQPRVTRPSPFCTRRKIDPMPRATPPTSHRDLLDRPLFAHLATVRPDGAPQSGLMWFAWDGERARFSHTRTRQKLRNLAHEPRVSFHLVDPDNPYRILEVRGRVESIDADPEASFYRSLQARYDLVVPVVDADDRVVITVAPTSFVAVDAGLTDKEMIALTARLATNDRRADNLGDGSDQAATGVSND